eukprot:670322-Pelagomonas_calceolata.AAC.2
MTCLEVSTPTTRKQRLLMMRVVMPAMNRGILQTLVVILRGEHQKGFACACRQNKHMGAEIMSFQYCTCMASNFQADVRMCGVVDSRTPDEGPPIMSRELVQALSEPASEATHACLLRHDQQR